MTHGIMVEQIVVLRPCDSAHKSFPAQHMVGPRGVVNAIDQQALRNVRRCHQPRSQRCQAGQFEFTHFGRHGGAGPVHGLGQWKVARLRRIRSRQQNRFIHAVDLRAPAKGHRQIKFLVDDIERFGHTSFAHGAQAI